MDGTIEQRLAAVERAQLGLSTYRQLRALGLSEKAVRHRVARGRLARVRPRVFANPAVPASPYQGLLAAVLAGGLHTFASHTSAARLWELPVPHDEARFEATTVLERQPRVEDVRMHRSGLLVDPDVTCVHSVPATSVERTIFDLSSRLDPGRLGRVLDDALRRRITSSWRVHRLLDRLPPAPGRSPSKVRAVLAMRIPGADARESVLEDFVFDALRRYRVPLPVPQHRVVVGGKERRIDLCYPAERLALEAQGYEYHGLRSRFDEDALRGNELQLAGFRVLEFTSAFTDWQVADHVARALGRPRILGAGDAHTFASWCAARDRLCAARPYRGGGGTNDR